MERFTGYEASTLARDDLPAAAAVTQTAEFESINLQLATGTEISAVQATEFKEPFGLRAKERHQVGPARAMDVGLALLILGFVLPLMAFCALAVLLSSRGPVLFRQTRIGRDAREFTCLKFRTMDTCAERTLDQLLNSSERAREEWARNQKVLADPRVTWVGRFLRRYSLDELPQLFNVLKGDMSIVGPRPIVAAEIHRYGAMFSDYCNVRPGLTGLWQVSGAHALTYAERVRLDAEYANSKSVRLDLLILLKTVPVVLAGGNS